MAYAWKKITPLDTIEVCHYHNWIDNRQEDGLRIGLRKFPDDAKYPLGEKPIFKLYQDLGTEREEAACVPLPSRHWSQAIHSGAVNQSGLEEVRGPQRVRDSSRALTSSPTIPP